MTLAMTLHVSGHTIGEQLATEPEDLAYALLSLTVTNPITLGEQVGGYLAKDYAVEVATHLRAFADAIEEAE